MTYVVPNCFHCNSSGYLDAARTVRCTYCKEAVDATTRSRYTVGSGDFSIGSKVWPGTSKLLEEMGELQQVLGKLIAVAGSTEHWDGDLRPRLVEECADIAAALQFFTVENFSREELLAMLMRSEQKKMIFRQWHEEHGQQRCSERSPMDNRCVRQVGHPGKCHANDGKHTEDWMNK